MRLTPSSPQRLFSRRHLLRTAGLGLAAAPLLHCTRTVQAAGHGGHSHTLTMQLDWKFNVQFAGLLLSDGMGLYEDAALSVELLPWESGIVVPEVVAANPQVMGCAEQNLILAAQAAGAPIKAVATMFQASPLALMTLPETAVTSIEDLRGQSVGVHVDGLAVMELVQGVSGFAPGEIEVIEIPYENKYEKLLSGELAAIQCYAVDEPVGFAEAYGIAPDVLNLSDYGYEAYAQVIVAHDELIETAPEQISQFLKATFAGWSMTLADIPAAAAQVVDHYVEPGSKYEDLSYQTNSLALVADYMLLGIEPEALGTIDPDRWLRMAERFAEYGILEVAPSLESSLTTAFWPPA
ncbi:MAG: ABC transporter substrate-binding protein [Cyanobacteria bacterium J06632_22]